MGSCNRVTIRPKSKSDSAEYCPCVTVPGRDTFPPDRFPAIFF